MDSHPAGSLYFIALVPPQPIFDRAWEIKEYFAEKYDSRAALKSPPHITLHMPFRTKEKKEGRLVDELQAMLGEVRGFQIDLDGFDAFAPRVIYIDVEKTERLTELYRKVRSKMQKLLHQDNADWKNRGFTPHLTVAFRDLKRRHFEEDWEEFRERHFTASWHVQEVCLLKHGGKQWEPYKKFNLVQS